MIKLPKLKAKRFIGIAKRGFSLIELLVVIGIFIIITSVILARQNKFSSDILLTDLAYQVAISIRQAQVYGLGVQAQSSNFDIGYGVHFDNVTPNTTYKLFADNDKNGVYNTSGLGFDVSSKNRKLAFAGGALPPPDPGDPPAIPPPSGGGGPGDTILNTYQVQKGDQIYDVCAVKSGIRSCFRGSNTLSSLDIVYIRPNPDSIIRTNGDPNSGPYSQAIITIISSLGDRFKCVKVDQTGQVSVYNPSDPNSPSVCS
jgi:prepilin-type N-terminal cleavage/methylation domain-containing protein